VSYVFATVICEHVLSFCNLLVDFIAHFKSTCRNYIGSGTWFEHVFGFKILFLALLTYLFIFYVYLLSLCSIKLGAVGKLLKAVKSRRIRDSMEMMEYVINVITTCVTLPFYTRHGADVVWSLVTATSSTAQTSETADMSYTKA
jgi:hypothetical protein